MAQWYSIMIARTVYGSVSLSSVYVI